MQFFAKIAVLVFKNNYPILALQLLELVLLSKYAIVIVMALEQESKNGGPYTKEEQEIRRNKVFELYFEKGYSAVKIADIIGVNRNTANKDIQYWYSEFRESEHLSNKDWFNKQLRRLEFQRVRLQEELEKEITLKERMQIENGISKIDITIASLVVKIETKRRYPGL